MGFPHLGLGGHNSWGYFNVCLYSTYLSSGNMQVIMGDRKAMNDNA